ncbi:MAG: hypothetical protein ACXWNZ_02935 [Vulcanimicrobiaceae bacterium]
MPRKRLTRTSSALALLVCFSVVSIVHAAHDSYRATLYWSGPGLPSDAAATGATSQAVVALVVEAHLVAGSTSLHVDIEPAPSVMPAITWSVADVSHVQLTTGNPYVHEMRVPGDSLSTPSPPENRINAIPGTSYGFTTVTAAIGPPVSQRVTIPVYAYRALNVGCSFGHHNGVRFDPHGYVRSAETPRNSDIYVTGPLQGPGTGLFEGCQAAFASDISSSTLHVPGGGILIPNTSSTPFAAVSPSMWKHTITEVSTLAYNQTLLFRTRDGRYVKAITGSGTQITGPYIVANSAQTFDDARMQNPKQAARAWNPPERTEQSFHARIIYADPLAATLGEARQLFTALPFHERTPFIDALPTARVDISPRPYTTPSIDWSVDGASLRVGSGAFGAALQPGAATGRSTLRATIGAPVNATVSIPVATYDSLVVGCGIATQGIAFKRDGSAVASTGPANSDLYISSAANRFDCSGETALYFPGGGVMLTNGTQGSRKIADGAEGGPQFPEITSRAWHVRYTMLDLALWRHLTGPCDIPESPGVVRVDYGCTTVSASTLLFRTRDGRLVKVLLIHANGTAIMGGPFAVSDGRGAFPF